MEKCCGWYNYLYSVSYLTLTAGDKGIKCLSTLPKQCRKGTVRDATTRHDGDLVSAACHSAPLAAQPPATYAWKGPRATRWWVCWSAGTEWLLACRGKVPCLGRCLAASGSLPLAGPCRDAWCVAVSTLRCLGWPSRQAPLAGALSPWLEYFVLEWLQRNHRGYWRSPGKPCRGTLRLPVHKFGILGYPYSSTPTASQYHDGHDL